MRAFLGANLLVAVFCAFALLALIHGPDGVSADCASGLCSHPCSVSQSACSNCYNIDAPRQCGGGGGSHGNHKTVIINGDGHRVAARMKRDEAQLAAAADSILPSSLLRAKRDWKLDMKTEIQKNKAEPLEQQQHVIDDNANVPIAADGRGTVLPSSRTKRDYWEDLGYEKPKKLGEVVINGTVHPIMSCPSCRIN